MKDSKKAATLPAKRKPRYFCPTSDVGLLNFVQWRDRPQAFTNVALFTEDDHVPTNVNFLQIFVELRKLDADSGAVDGGRLFLKALRDSPRARLKAVRPAWQRAGQPLRLNWISR